MTELTEKDIYLINEGLKFYVNRPNESYPLMNFVNNLRISADKIKDHFINKGLIKISDTPHGILGEVYIFTKLGKRLLELGDYDLFADEQLIAPQIEAKKRDDEYVRQLDIIIKQQQARLNELELKIKPQNHTFSKISLIVAVISLLTSVGLWQWLIKLCK